MDIVYLVKNNPENNSEELRYSLRSLKNIPHNKVIIAGEKPDWATNVTYLPVPQTGTKGENVSANFAAAIASELVSDDFLLMNDDFFIMKKIPEMPNINFGRMVDVITKYDQRYPEGTEYIQKMKSLHVKLVSLGFEDPICYELHTPMIFNKQRVKRFFNEVEEPLYQLRSFYGNFFQIGGEAVPDVKVFLKPQHNNPEYNQNPEKYLEEQVFLSVTGGSFKRGLPGDFVRSKFTEKSEYEV